MTRHQYQHPHIADMSEEAVRFWERQQRKDIERFEHGGSYAGPNGSAIRAADERYLEDLTARRQEFDRRRAARCRRQTRAQ